MQFRTLRVTGQQKIQSDCWLEGFCCDDSKIYCLERPANMSVLYLREYDVSSFSLLDQAGVPYSPFDGHPRVDNSHRVYVPSDRSGLLVFRCQSGRLLPARDPLRCVRDACSICVNTGDTLFVCGSGTVCLVSVSRDTVIRQLRRPAQVWGDPRHVSVLGQTVLVCYGINTLVIYRSDSPTPGRVLQTPGGLEFVNSIITDSHSSSFLVTDSQSVFVLDVNLFWHRIVYKGAGIRGLLLEDEHRRAVTEDCAVVQSQLWLGYGVVGIIDVLTSTCK